MFDARPLLVIPHDGKYIIIGGNLRFEGCKKNNVKDAPCYVFPDNTPIDKLKEIVIKDNGAFGAWDFDMLANEWDNLPLTDWGVPAWDTTDLDVSDVEPPKDISDQIVNEFKVEVTCVNEAEQEQLYNKLIDEGYECRILTL